MPLGGGEKKRADVNLCGTHTHASTDTAHTHTEKKKRSRLGGKKKQ